MKPYNIIDEVTGKPRMLSEQCKTCIMRPDSPVARSLRRGRLKQILADQSGIVCHSTFTGVSDVDPALCRGAADRVPSQMIRIYERTGGFTYVDPPTVTDLAGVRSD